MQLPVHSYNQNNGRLVHVCMHIGWFSKFFQCEDCLSLLGVNGEIVCVQSSNFPPSYGVIYIAENKILKCATCRFGSSTCEHVAYLKSMLENIESLPSLHNLLSYFVSNLKFSVSINEKSVVAPSLYKLSPSCLSLKPLPFSNDAHQHEILGLPYQERFNICDGTSLLKPDLLSLPCVKCGNLNWSKEDLLKFEDAVIITLTQMIPTKGMVILLCISMQLKQMAELLY